MSNDIKISFLDSLTERFGSLHRISGSQSLFDIGNGAARIYIRYSKLHNGDETFYGLRQDDLQKLEGHRAFICFLWDNQTDPLIVPFEEYEDVFSSISPARDGQYKAQIYLQDEGAELYVGRAGRFNVEGHFGWDKIVSSIDETKLVTDQQFTHSQVQTLLGAIGSAKGYDIWLPQCDRGNLDWSLAERFSCALSLPQGLDPVMDILQEIDVVWLNRGSSSIRALFEVEHSTPIYSGLLRFNDIHLSVPNFRTRFSVVANETRRSLFVRQLNRPTFRTSGLSEMCTFLEYMDVFAWHARTSAV